MAVPPPVVVVVVLVVIVIVVVGWGDTDLLTVRGNDLLTRASRDNELLTFRGATIC